MSTTHRNPTTGSGDQLRHPMTPQPATPPAPQRGVRIPAPALTEQDMPHPIVARLALEVLWRQFFTTVPGHLEPEEEQVNSAMQAMHEMLWRKERQTAAETGQYCHHLIVRPVNPLNMPAPGELAEIADALATLDRHDLLARPWADEETT
jgi:hypothetical protein